LFLAKQEGYTLYALTFDYGQVHKRELQNVKKIGEAAGVKNHVLFTVDLHRFGGSSLVDKNITIPKNKRLDEIGNQIPPTYVPARNTVFLSLALAYAETIPAEAIFIGAHATDYSGYPDCRPEYFDAYQKMANQATRAAVEGHPIQIKTPILSLSKAEIIKKGVEVNAPLHLTWSCYQGGKKACGQCDSCLLRLKGFQDMGTPDPIQYHRYPSWYMVKK